MPADQLLYRTQDVVTSGTASTPFGLENEKNLEEAKQIDIEATVIVGEMEAKERTYPLVTKLELMAYYFYNNGANGIGPNGYSATQFQNVLTLAGHEQSLGVGSACVATSATCMVPWLSSYMSVSQIVLVASGLAFMSMTLIFLSVGSIADYRNNAQILLITLTLICWACQFAFIAVRDGAQWRLAMGLYIISLVTWGCILVFYGAMHPMLSRHTRFSRELQIKRVDGEITEEEFEKEEALQRSDIMSVAEAHSNWGYLLAPVLSLSVQLTLPSSNAVNNYVIVLCTGWWMLTGLPWFFMQKKRPGPPLPKGSNYFTLGYVQLYQSIKEIKKLPMTFGYLVAFFFLADGLNTTGSIVSICQNDVINFSFLDSTYLNIVQAVCSLISIYFLRWVQLRWKIPTKWMFAFNCAIAIIIPFWGMLGWWTDKIGFHHVSEFWAWNVIFGLGQASYYNYSFIVMGDLCPPGFEGMFFGVFGLSNRASSIMGPNVAQTIIAKTGVNQSGFVFCFALVVVSTFIQFTFIDMERGNRDAIQWAKDKRAEQLAQSLRHHG